MLNKRLIGSQVALVLGTSGMLSGLATVTSGASTSGLMTGPVMILGAAAYSSRKRRLLGLKPETTARKTFEAVCLALITTTWLGDLDLANAVRNNPASHLMIPLWALIAYPCASFRTEKHRVADPLEESWAKLRTFLWATPIAMALTFAGFAALLVAGSAISGTRAGTGNSLQDFAPPPQPADVEIIQTARTLRCDFDDMPSEIVIDAVNHGTGFGEARIVGNAGASDAGVSSDRRWCRSSAERGEYHHRVRLEEELRFVAVYSRHNEIFGTPTPSQQLGAKSWGSGPTCGERQAQRAIQPEGTTSNRVEMWDSTW